MSQTMDTLRNALTQIESQAVCACIAKDEKELLEMLERISDMAKTALETAQ